MDETNRDRVMILRDAQLKQGDKKRLIKPVPGPVSARKTEVLVSPRKTEFPAKLVQDEAQNELLDQDDSLIPETHSDPVANAKASEDWPEQYFEEPDR